MHICTIVIFCVGERERGKERERERERVINHNTLKKKKN